MVRMNPPTVNASGVRRSPNARRTAMITRSAAPLSSSACPRIAAIAMRIPTFPAVLPKPSATRSPAVCRPVGDSSATTSAPAISHAGFGGIGTGWRLSLAFPALGNGGAVYAIAVVFCIAIAFSIGFVTREHDAAANGERFGADSAIGIFLVASLAWGIVALALYDRHRPGVASRELWEKYLFGTIAYISPDTMIASVAVSTAVVFAVAALFKEILYYAF